MARKQPTPIAGPERRGGPPLPLPTELGFHHCLLLHRICGIVSIAGATTAYIVATFFIESHFVGEPEPSTMGQLPGAQPPVVEVLSPRPHNAPIDGPFRIIRRLRVERTFWAFFVIMLIAMSIPRGPISRADLSVDPSTPTTYVPTAGRAEMTVGHTANVEMDPCLVTLEVNGGAAKSSGGVQLE